MTAEELIDRLLEEVKPVKEVEEQDPFTKLPMPPEPEWNVE